MTPEQTEILNLLDKPEFPRSSKYNLNWVIGGQMGPNVLWLTEWLCEGLLAQSGPTVNSAPNESETVVTSCADANDAIVTDRANVSETVVSGRADANDTVVSDRADRGESTVIDKRVIDLGCGKALSSVFAAREFGWRVWAADLWIDPDFNWSQVQKAGLENQVYPVKAEAHNLPFPAAFFDGLISIDAWQYFGTDVLYLDYICRFIRPGGFIGIVVPGLIKEFPGRILGQPGDISERPGDISERPSDISGQPGDISERPSDVSGQPGDISERPGTIPAHLKEPQSNGKIFWEPECRCFKTLRFWSELFGECPFIELVDASSMEDGWKHWADFEDAVQASGMALFPSDAEALRVDKGEFIGFHRIIARRNSNAPENLYDPTIGVKCCS